MRPARHAPLVAVLLLLGLVLTPNTAQAGPTAPAAAVTPVAANGQLKVCGTKLCNQRGKTIQLRGMSTHGLQWYSQCVTHGSLDALAGDWRADVLRVSMYVQEGGYETDPRRFTDLVHATIEQATARGLYAIVDWHMLAPGDPHHNLARARTFFSEIAEYSFTGMFTRPKLIDPLQIARGMRNPHGEPEQTFCPETHRDRRLSSPGVSAHPADHDSRARATRSVPKAVRMARYRRPVAAITAEYWRSRRAARVTAHRPIVVTAQAPQNHPSIPL